MSYEQPSISPTELPTLYYPAPKPKRTRWGLILGLLLLLGATAVFGLVAAAGIVIYQSDWVVPGVQTMGVDLGSQPQVQAEAVLQTNWDNRTIALAASESDMWLVSPNDLGITLNVPETVQAAYSQGRTVDGLVALLTTGHISVAPVWQLDGSVAEAHLRELSPQLDKEPVNAGIQIVDGKAQAVPAVPGYTFNVDETMVRFVQNGAEVVLNGRLALVVDPIEPAITDASELVDRANQLLSTTLNIHAYDPIRDEATDWTISPDVWGNWVLVNAVPPGDLANFSWMLDENKVAATMSQYADLGDGRYLDTAEAITAVTQAIASQHTAVNLRIYHQPQTHIIQPGETLASLGYDYGIPYPWIQAANPDLGDALSVGQALTIPSLDEMLPLPVVENKRIIVSISQQKVYVYENGALKWEWLASTGINSSPTAPGIFQIQAHEPNAYAGNWDLWMPSFMGIYRPVPTSDFMNGFHGFPTRNGYDLLWTGDLGHKVTYGCVLLSNDNVNLLYEWAEDGVVVEIQG
jgi:lipoprotein-anchoring transpeptidase ErfK/SrfK